jgi:hypothetical protein
VNGSMRFIERQKLAKRPELLRLGEEKDKAGNRQECDGRSDGEACVHLLLATLQARQRHDAIVPYCSFASR